jgi:hypothetical protein
MVSLGSRANLFINEDVDELNKGFVESNPSIVAGSDKKQGA